MPEISSETCHTADCLLRAADHLKEAITLLMCSDADDLEPTIHVIKPIIRELERKAKP